jgi:hypothetical protein
VARDVHEFGVWQSRADRFFGRLRAAQDDQLFAPPSLTRESLETNDLLARPGQRAPGLLALPPRSVVDVADDEP